MTRDDLDDLYPLTPTQQGMLLQCLRAPHAGLYVTQITLTLGARADVPALRAAWGALIRRHAAFRTAFFWEGLDEPLQAVVPDAPLDLVELDWSEHEPARAEAELASHLERERQRGFELSAPPLLRVTHVALAGDRAHLIWTCHHLLIDGWSQGQILQEFAAAYGAALGGTAPPALPPPPAFRDYVGYLQARPERALAEAWGRRLAGANVPLSLGIDRGPPPQPTRAASRRELLPELYRGLERFAREHRLTLPALFAGAWGLLLGRYGGESDVLFGATVSGRHAPLRDIDAMVGMLISTVPLRLRLPADAPLVPWLREVQSIQAEAQELAHCPAAELRRWAGLGPADALFDCLLVYENFPLEVAALAAGGLRVESLRTHDENHDALTLTLTPRADRLAVEIAFHRERFDPPAVARMHRHLEALLRSFLDDPASPLAERAARATDDAAELAAWEGALAAPPFEPTLPEMLAACVRRKPDAPALVCGPDWLSWAELGARAGRLAVRLRARGVGPERVVPVVAPRGIDAVVGMMAVAMAGGAWAPIDANHPAERARRIAAELSAPVALASGERAARLAAEAFGVRVERLDEDPGPGDPGSELAPPPRPEHLAYVIFTSGSTGRPKGVMVEHRSLAYVAACWRRVYGLDDYDVRLLQIGNFAADVFVGDWLKVLATGGTMVVCPDEQRLDLHAVHRLLSEHRITVLESTPSFITALGGHLFRQGLPARSLRLVIFGADYLRTGELRTLLGRLGPKTRVVNGYGLTECTIESSIYECAPDTLAATRSGYAPLGRPFPGTRLLVLDGAGRRLPVGAVGELYVGGPGVARGYLGDPALSAERFVERDGERFYRTGDLARWGEGGDVEHFGRGDHLVKVRGHRVELGEVENALLALSGVRQAAVVPLEGGESLGAYLALEPSAELGAVQAALGGKLPAYMQPSRFVALEVLPLNANGKVDRRALSAASPSAEGARLAPAEPLSGLESRLVELWREVLGAEHVGLDDSFLALGGTSLQLLRLFDRLREQLGSELQADLQVADLFNHHTVRQLARHLEGCLAPAGRP